MAVLLKGLTVTAGASDPGLEDTLRVVTRWFFDDYLNRWASVANGTCPEGPIRR